MLSLVKIVEYRPKLPKNSILGSNVSEIFTVVDSSADNGIAAGCEHSQRENEIRNSAWPGR